MIDPFEELREDLEGAIKRTVAAIDERYREPLELAIARGADRRRMLLLRRRAREINDATRPLVAAYARIPPRPIDLEGGSTTRLRE